ncbi:permease prefix domain 1-containing protein [Actinoplanes sp. NPDC023801]|uniref:permease prefix domain 1-containing protein n=1 Tax=Actinoplanes sp. NPDC023801 TaxID=3154595 RepID=UPI0033CD8C85
MTTLIDRYVFTVLRRVPEQQRAEIERELRTSIDDAVDARVDGGEGRDAAVEAALLELGDPDRLADGYADRPQYLIGPMFYPQWKRVLTMLLSIVLPAVVTVGVIIRVLGDATFGEVIGTAVSTTLTVGAHMVFWVTLTFGLLDRAGVEKADLRRRAWTPEDLPRHEPGLLTPAQLGATVLWPVLLIAALVLQQFSFTEEPVLDPANWSFWWPYLIVVLALEGLYGVWVFRRGAWSHSVTAANAALGVLFTVPVAWLAATGRFFNPAWIAGLDWGTQDPLAWLTGVTITIAVAGAIYDIAEVAVRAERARRGLATPVPGTGREFTSPLS